MVEETWDWAFFGLALGIIIFIFLVVCQFSSFQISSLRLQILSFVFSLYIQFRSPETLIITMGESDPLSRVSVHQALGGGSAADLLLWRRWCGVAVCLFSASSLWFLFERVNYNLLSFVANVVLLLVVILFLSAKSASILNRPLPPFPDMEIFEESVVKAVDVIRVWINYALSIARDIAVGRNVKLFLQVAFGLWVVSYIGSLFNFLTLVYIEVVLSLSVPVLYDKYQDHIDDKLRVTHRVIQTQYKKIDDNILRKIPMLINMG